jgi:hypothetical protein
MLAAAVTIFLGILVAADGRFWLAPAAGMAILLGLFIGCLNGMEMARMRPNALVAVGIASAPFLVIALIAGHVAPRRVWWARVAVGVAGSWIAASGLFMLGWAFRRG